MNSENNVHSPDFQSKIDPFFTSVEKEPKGTNYTRWGKDEARSALATTRPTRFWAQGAVGTTPESKMTQK